MTDYNDERKRKLGGGRMQCSLESRTMVGAGQQKSSDRQHKQKDKSVG